MYAVTSVLLVSHLPSLGVHARWFLCQLFEIRFLHALHAAKSSFILERFCNRGMATTRRTTMPPSDSLMDVDSFGALYNKLLDRYQSATSHLPPAQTILLRSVALVAIVLTAFGTVCICWSSMYKAVVPREGRTGDVWLQYGCVSGFPASHLCFDFRQGCACRMDLADPSIAVACTDTIDLRMQRFPSCPTDPTSLRIRNTMLRWISLCLRQRATSTLVSGAWRRGSHSVPDTDLLA